jgi:ribonuclease VapC
VIVDSSALVAILRAEPDASRYAAALERAASRRISAANWLETAIVVSDPADPVTGRRFDEFVREAELVIEPVTARQAGLARAAYRDFGKGSGHPARLNFGDCFAYALAADSGEPLLFKGDDFSHTDLRSALDQPGGRAAQ